MGTRECSEARWTTTERRVMIVHLLRIKQNTIYRVLNTHAGNERGKIIKMSCVESLKGRVLV